MSGNVKIGSAGSGLIFADGTKQASAATGGGGGGATLGANTFSGPQTIDVGNLDLDQSTATAGNVLKDDAGPN